MDFNQQQAVERARRDLAQRLGLSETEITAESVDQFEFPDAALGAASEDEMSAQVITPGWRLRFKANGQTYEYRANPRQLRLFNFKGQNLRI